VGIPWSNWMMLNMDDRISPSGESARRTVYTSVYDQQWRIQKFVLGGGRSIYFHLRSQIFFWPSLEGGGDRPHPPPPPGSPTDDKSTQEVVVSHRPIQRHHYLPHPWRISACLHCVLGVIYVTHVRRLRQILSFHRIRCTIRHRPPTVIAYDMELHVTDVTIILFPLPHSHLHRESKKTRHQTLAHNFTKYWTIFKILSLLDSVGNL